MYEYSDYTGGVVSCDPTAATINVSVRYREYKYYTKYCNIKYNDLLLDVLYLSSRINGQKNSDHKMNVLSR